MSRIGRLPVEVPSGVDVKINGSQVKIKGPKGEMEFTFSPSIDLSFKDGEINVTRSSDAREMRSLHGTTRALIQNMIIGVTDGFQKELQLVGVGYRAAMQGKNLVLNVGYSHQVEVEPPQGIDIVVGDRAQQIFISGIDKQKVGQVAADIRKIRKPEPYKGKGIRYKDERIRRKAGKAGKVE
ncbi:MAG: 50S ribosomal protein L6 [Anaerolineales bacterium]|nr:50S ribosomal protein L6 [Anaerolineales bacterium]